MRHSLPNVNLRCITLISVATTFSFAAHILRGNAWANLKNSTLHYGVISNKSSEFIKISTLAVIYGTLMCHNPFHYKWLQQHSQECTWLTTAFSATSATLNVTDWNMSIITKLPFQNVSWLTGTCDEWNVLFRDA